VQWINDNSPVKVKFVPIARSQSTSLINAMYAAGTAPDVVWEYNKSFMDGLYAQGVIQPVGDYIEKYSTAYKQYQKDHPQMMPYLIADDGLQYGISSMRNILTTVNQSIFVRKDWLDKFGMKIPTTPDEAIAFMRLCRDQDPSGLGTWGVGTDYSWRITAQTMFGCAGDEFNIVNGHFQDWYSTPAYRDALAYRAQIYQEGLIDPEIITDTNFTRQKQFMVTGRIAMRFQGLGFQGDYFDFIKNVPTADFVPIDPLTTSYGKFGYNTEVPILKMVCMSKTCRNPKAVMQYLDWLITDGYYTLSWGLEGRHYRLVNGVPQVIDAALNRVEKDYLSGNYEFALVDNNQITVDWIPIQAAQDPVSQDWARRYAAAVQISIDNPFNRQVPYGPTSDSIVAFNTAISSQVDAIETNILTGKIGVDEGVRQINDFKRASGWDAINAEKDAWFQKNKALFGY
ncbi:MAG: extracellular solute-binding protein, partial [Treponema sp.]|nr:extracellular solute-binding protein [Treponema sp.]